jgi:rubrerythrin
MSMKEIDSQKAARVWQRVQGKTSQSEDFNSLPSMIAGEWWDAATYLRLSRQFNGKEANFLRKMFEDEQSHAACLKGIYTLLTGDRLVTQTPAPRQEPLSASLRRCYGREMQCLAQYEKWSDHREYGPVFQRLAQQERAHCAALLEILGNLKEKA